ncbi:MAG: hypothetical protein KUG82_18610 [Pseudomonadales bacterium]|nr:hypothetical protein [Pseudomonadales bacterium]
MDWYHPLQNHDCVLAVVIDVTKQKDLEAQLRQAQKMESISVLTGGIAHKMNNVFTPIIGYAEMF